MGKTVLVTDDQHDAAQLLAYLLRMQGYETIIASDGVEALHRLTSEKPDVVILDLMLPERNGWEFLDAKAKIPEFDRIPVIVYSGFTEIAEPMPGVFAVLKKPAESSEVIKLIEEALAKGGTNATPAV